MATYIKTLKEDNGDIVYPQTNTDAVYTSGGETLETRISKYVTAEDVAQSVQSFGTVTVGMLDWSGIMDKIYPVGSIYMSATLTTPAAVATALGGTWVAWGAGRVPVGVDANDTDFDAAEETGGSKDMQKHSHTRGTMEIAGSVYGDEVTRDSGVTATGAFKCPSTNDYSYGGTGGFFGGGYNYRLNNGFNFKASRNWTGATSEEGDGTSGNLQPYITCYMYKRTA